MSMSMSMNMSSTLSHYKTQKELKQHVRNMVDSIGVCSSIKESHPEKWPDFIYLFKRHSDYPQKFYGLADIMICYNPIFKKQLETLIVKSNGEIDDVSLLNNCITGKPNDNLTIAMRNAIYPQIEEFKNNSILKCLLCSDTKDIHIDHFEPQFIDLKKQFSNNWKGTIPNRFEQNDSHSKIFYKQGYDFCSTDKDFEKEWIEYHKKYAVLRVLCRKCNLTRKKSKKFK